METGNLFFLLKLYLLKSKFVTQKIKLVTTALTVNHIQLQRNRKKAIQKSKIEIASQREIEK
jgi:hypothetical protein